MSLTRSSGTKKLFALGFFAGSFLVGSLRASTIYYAAPAVLGSGDGLSAANAFQICNFTQNASRALPGNTLQLLDGHYTGLCSMIQPAAGLSGSAGNLITVRALNDGGVDIDGEGIRGPVALSSTNNYWDIEGIDAHSCGPSSGGIYSIGGSHNILRRDMGWDTLPDRNQHIFSLNGSVPNDSVHGFGNLVEDCGAFGVARKDFQTFYSAGNTFRRVWGQWMRSVNTGPKRVLQSNYHSFNTLVEDLIVSVHGDMPDTYILQNNGAPFIVGSCGLGVSQPDGSCLYTGGRVNEPDGYEGEGDAYDSALDPSPAGNARILGMLVYVRGSDLVYTKASNLTTYGLVSHVTFGNTTIWDAFVYAPGVIDSNGAVPVMGFKLGAISIAPQSSVTNFTSICPTLDFISGKYTQTNGLHGTTLSALGSETLYEGTTGAHIKYRYVDGVLTNIPLWPWPMASRILAATTKAHGDPHGHVIEDIDATVQGIFGPYPPSITSVSPGTGPVGAGVVITGANLGGATSLRFNGTGATFTVDGPTQITATVPLGATPGSIAVTTPGGTATTSSAFVVIPAPTIAGFSPPSGPSGTSVTIAGADFGGATTVTLGPANAAFTVDSASQITATIPSGAMSGPFLVTTAGGTATSASGFTIIPPPTAASFSPTGGPIGTVVTITGTDLDWTSAVALSGVNASFSVVSPTRLAATVPSGATTGPIVVTTPGGTATCPGVFTVGPAPAITDFTPAKGPPGASVIVSGSHFGAVTSVSFNGAGAPFTLDSASQITAMVPSDATTGPIAVSAPTGTAESAAAFVVGPAPAISGVGLSRGAVGDVISIVGADLSGVTRVAFDGTDAAFFTVNTPTQITATVPIGASTGRITVDGADGNGVSPVDFTVTTFSPVMGPSGTLVTLTGASLGGATGVTFNGVNASFTVDSDTQLSATVPPGATTGTIAVEGGGFSDSTDFTATWFSPVAGPFGADVTIRGTGLGEATAVTFDGVGASFTVDSDSQLTATVPPAATTGPIVVSAPGGDVVSPVDFTPAPFSPVSGPTDTSVTIRGANLTGTTAVDFNGTAATYTQDSDSQVTAAVPAGAMTGPITLTTSGGSVTSASHFRVTSPALAAFHPANGGFGVSVVFTGANFGGATDVQFNGTAATFTVDAPIQITAVIPNGASTGPIVITTPNGTAASAEDFEVTAPTIASFNPTSGPVGTSVVVSGTHFTGVTSLTFNGTSATFTVDSATQITTAAPAGAATGPIALTSPDGSVTSAGAFTVIPAPKITGFSPVSGPASASVTITGTGLTGATAVQFNGIGAAAFTVDSAIQITATVPAAATTGAITVTTSGGTATSAAPFTVIPAPAITSFSPASGPVGTTSLITGTGLSGATAIKFNGVAASTFTVDSATQITATVPVGATTGTIAVTTPGGTSASLGSFTVIPAPGITSFSPTTGAVGATVVITGTNLTGATAVKLNGTAAPFTVDSATQVTATVPSGAMTGPIALTTPGGGVTSASSFTVIPAPSVGSFSPASGPVGTGVVITGINLTGATAVDFNGASASFSVDSATQITAPVPAGAATGPIAVTTPGGTAVSAASFTVILAPTIASFSPTSGPLGASVVITGTALTGATSVRFNGSSAVTFTVDSSTQITATAPLAATTGPIAVTTPGGSAASASNFTVIPAPSIASFNPTSGPLGTSVVITGSNLTGATAVKFNGTAATVVTVNSATQITAAAPAGATTGPIGLTTPGGTANSAGAFTVILAPTIASFSPTSGPVGISVVVTGANLSGTTSIRFNGTSATAFTVNSATQVTASMPPGATTGPITVTTPGGTATSSPFTVIAAPTISSFAPTSGAGGASVVITGSALSGATSVAFNGASAAFTVNSATKITATVPSAATTGSLVVIAPGGTAASAGSFTVVPKISSFAPTSGSAGANVVITGTTLTGTTAVLFNGTGAPFSINSATQITATVPASATTGKIAVTAPGGTATSASNFTVKPAISSFSPASGPVGTSVVITGISFTGATSVTFNVTAAAFTVNSATQITATVPAGATTGKIKVATAGGTATSASNFTVSPTISAFSPASGSVGSSIVITGANLSGATSVTFGGTSATFSVNSATQITATVPSGAASGPVGVTTPGGVAASASSFAVTPKISSFSPTSGLVGDSVTITGTTFTAATSVTFNGTSAAFTVNSATHVTATVPSGATTGRIGVSTPAGTATSASNYLVKPAISSFSPTSGTVGTSVTVTGTSFTGATAVTFNGIGGAFSVNSSTQITATVPAGATTGRIKVTTPGGTATSAGSFSLKPAISGFSPASGPAGTTVVVTGTTLTGASSVKFHNTSAAFTVNSSTQITATVPAAATTGTITVTTPAGTATSASSFTVTATP